MSADRMPSARIHLRLEPGRVAPGWVRPLADAELWTESPLGATPRPAPVAPVPPPPPVAEWTTVYDGPGLDLGVERRVVSRRATDGTRQVEYEDGERFRISADGRWIVREPSAAPPSPGSLERGLGAPLALALAARGVFLLHASAVAGPRGVVALTADSGTGKSTLAAAARGLPEWEWIADDQLPVRLGAAPRALPQFPQLKLATDEEYPAGAPSERPWVALVELERCGPETPLALDRLDPGHAALALVRATTASRLFDGRLLAEHLDACAGAASSLLTARLRYPSGRQRLPEILAQLSRI